MWYSVSINMKTKYKCFHKCKTVTFIIAKIFSWRIILLPGKIMAGSVYILEVFRFYIIILSQVIDFFHIWHDQRTRVEVDVLIPYSQVYSCR